MCVCERDIMVTENFTHYNIFDNVSNKPAQQIVYHRMSESPDPNCGEGVGNKGLFFYGAYNPRISYVSNRDYDADIVSHRHHNVTKKSDGSLVTRIRDFFCCG